MEEPEPVPPKVQRKKAISILTASMSEETTQRIEPYLEYNTTCNYEYRNLMSHLVEQFGIKSF
ncbi:hypothetical protein PVK06_039800 [Gossypium arboreum]|uniref:Uncharacterized protein n=1 Tax=Gossypium arboreum TaxID=29729 RepID=A0ABR0N5Y1_GOSAR|nr:hypothetical protein PVK06_039800 [Gossypium arboreum]